MVDRKGETPIHVAASRGRVQTVRALLKRPDVRPDQFSTSNLEWGRTPLFRAAKKGHLDVVRALSTHPDVDANKVEADGNTPLHVAAREGHVDVVAFLAREGGSNPHAKNHLHETPLHVVAERGNVESVYALMENLDSDIRGVLVDAKTRQGKTPISIAEERGDALMVKALREYVPYENILRDHLATARIEMNQDIVCAKKNRTGCVREKNPRRRERRNMIEKHEKMRDRAISRATERIRKKHHEMNQANYDDLDVIERGKRQKRETKWFEDVEEDGVDDD